MKAVQLLVQSTLPDDLRRDNYDVDARSLGDAMAEVARRHPDRYEEISKKLSDAGLHASYIQGETLGLEDLKPVVDKEKIFLNMDTELAAAKKVAKSDDDYKKQRLAIWARYSDDIEKVTMVEALKKGNNLGYSVASGARGKPAQLKMMLTTPGLYTDSNDNVIPLFVRNSFGQGLRPHEYLAGTYGARKSVLATKRATAKGGFLAKQMVQASSPMMVTEQDCKSSNGLDLDIHDKSLKNRVLAREVDGLPAGTVLDRAAITDLKKRGVENVIVRSALTCETGNGICSHCVGKNAEGNFPPIGEAVGITAAQSIGEPICLDENTLVRMADWTVKKIKDIKAGEMVLGSDMDGKLTPTRVVEVFHNGPRDCVATSVRKGRGEKSEVIEMISTRKHKVLSSQKHKGFERKIQPIDHKIWDRHAVYLSKGLLDDHLGLDEPWAALLGILVGDGAYGGTNRGVMLSCYDASTLAWAEEEVKQFGLFLEHAAHGEYRINMQDSSGVRNRVKHPLKLKLMKEEMWGQTCGSKLLPMSISSWSNRSIARFIGGYLSADGWVTKSGVIGFSSVSERLSEGLKRLLELRFGIYCTRITPKRKKRKGGGHYEPSFEFCISGREDILYFREVIPIPGVKGPLLHSITSKWKASPYERGRYKVISQEPVGVRDTWDIEVDNETHLFMLANNLIVSNTQGALNTKHTGGVGGGAKREYSGFDWINQFLQTPDQFKDRAVVAEKDGRVDRIEEAPQGGQYVTAAGERYYVPHGFDVEVKEGQTLEAGEQISTGLINPSDVVRLRGLGEGRRYFADRLKQMLDDSGMPADRRSTEMLARSAINHVTIDELDDPGGYLPDDVVSYNKYLSEYTPPEDTEPMEPSKAVGKMLQAPALHYSIGTRVTPSVAKRLTDAKWDRVQVSSQVPKFTSHMVRLQSASHNNPDWLAQQHTSYLKRQLSDSAARGQDTNIDSNVHFAPRLAVGQDFGKGVRESGEF